MTPSSYFIKKRSNDQLSALTGSGLDIRGVLHFGQTLRAIAGKNRVWHKGQIAPINRCSFLFCQPTNENPPLSFPITSDFT